MDVKRIALLTSFIFLIAGFLSAAQADIVINEVLGSTTGSDAEFVELYNTGSSAVDIGGWQIELWDSDTGSAYGGADAASPYVIASGTMISAGGFFLFANEQTQNDFSVTADFLLSANSIENSSYTMILKNASLSTINSIFVTDGGAGDAANDAGTAITPDLTVGPDGAYIPAGFYRTTDGADAIELQDFSDYRDTGTPGTMNAVPVPAAAWLLGSGLIGLIGIRRKEK
jgi:hypothetical protein